jgi:hypothetical protein
MDNGSNQPRVQKRELRREIGMLQGRPQRDRSNVAGTAVHDFITHDHLPADANLMNLTV